MSAADLPGADPLAALADADGPLAAGYAHAHAGTVADRAAWCAWTFGAFARALIRRGRDGEAEHLVDRIDALPLPADGPTGAVARFAHRETMRLRLALRQPGGRATAEPEQAGGAA